MVIHKKNILDKYADYLNGDILEFFYEKDQTLYTIEKCVLEVNNKNQTEWDSFRKAILKKDSMINKNETEVLSFMLANKTEWSMRIFDYDEKINYPQHILDAIKK